MSKKRSSVNWGKGFSTLIVLVLLALIVPVANATDMSVKLQPVLAQMATAQPDSLVSVIVQKSARDNRVEEALAKLDGKVTQDLHIINGFAAELKAKDVLRLAQADGVRWVSLDAPMVESACTQCIDTTNLKNAYVRTINADKVWNSSPYLQGQGIGVAVVDSGVNPQQDLYTVMGVNRLVAAAQFNGGYNQSVYDGYGHGNHVAGIIGGNGSRSSGAYIGVAPMVNIINVKVSDDAGGATAKNVVAGLQWVLDNKSTYNIRVVNLSLNSTVSESYHTSPIDAAAEILWFNKIVVVASAGNSSGNSAGTSSGNQQQGAIYPPANDPFVITVGATDDKGTKNIADDVVASFSSHGTTTDGFAKPDLVAPGTNIVALMANTNSALALAHPANVVNGIYFRMSGTSMAAPMVSGAAALLLQDEPNLTPDQVKYRLKATANTKWRGYNSARAGAGCLDVDAAVKGNTTASANTGTLISNLLFTGANPANGGSASWGSASWGSASWGSASWGSASWGSASWGSASWGSDYWGP